MVGELFKGLEFVWVVCIGVSGVIWFMVKSGVWFIGDKLVC